MESSTMPSARGRIRWVVGGGGYLEQVAQSWQKLCPQETVVRVEVPQNAGYEFDFSVLDALNPSEGDAFVAFDERFGNFKRLELFEAVRQRGFPMASCISASAELALDASIGKNVFIGPQVVVGHGCRIADNSVILSGAHIGSDSCLDTSVWLEPAVQIGNGVSIGAHATIRTGATVRGAVRVGRLVELGWPRVYDADVADKTIFDTRFDQPIYVYVG